MWSGRRVFMTFEEVAKTYVEIASKRKSIRLNFAVLYDPRFNSTALPPFRFHRRSRSNVIRVSFARTQIAETEAWLAETMRLGYLPALCQNSVDPGGCVVV